MIFTELDPTTREWMLRRFEAEESGGTPYRSGVLSPLGLAHWPDVMRQVITDPDGSEVTLAAALDRADYWQAIETYVRNGVPHQRRVNPPKRRSAWPSPSSTPGTWLDWRPASKGRVWPTAASTERESRNGSQPGARSMKVRPMPWPRLSRVTGSGTGLRQACRIGSPSRLDRAAITRSNASQRKSSLVHRMQMATGLPCSRVDPREAVSRCRLTKSINVVLDATS
jgi:hypothetical protein